MRSQRVGHGQGILPQCGTGLGSQTESEAKGNCEASIGTPRYELIDREQLCWRQIDIEGLIGAEHPARAVWELIGQVDLSAYQEELRAVEGKAGRPGKEPRLLISLWLCLTNNIAVWKGLCRKRATAVQPA